ncbi:FHA domain-containing protein [Nocardia vinacea]|uniref:FHA domain-containing protein n=1 Tax=Nocardia vinacea TaxID=96468 RepID=UPI0002FA43D0|nr:FHA domain-containing protein [Nocardia vinacea]
MSRQLEVLPGGTHLIANSGGVVLVVAHRSDIAADAESAAAQTMTALLELVREAGAQEQPRTGRMFARLATTWLMSLDDEDQVEFGVVTPSTSGAALFLHGGVTAVLETSGRAEVLHGRDAGFTVDRVVIPAPAIGIGLFVDEDGTTASALPSRGIAGLGEGTVPGAGAVLWFGAPASARAAAAWRPSGTLRAGSDVGGAGVGSPQDASSTEDVGAVPGIRVEDAERRESPRQAVELVDPVANRSGSEIEPEPERGAVQPPIGGGSAGKAAPWERASAMGVGNLPPRGAVSGVGERRRVGLQKADIGVSGAVAPPNRPENGVASVPGSGRAVVRGFMCSRQHLNDPRVSFCAVCGIRMDQLTCVLTEGVRPPLGLLMLDDGTSYVLDNDIVLGREPEHAEAVRRGARPIRLPDSSGAMSRAHMEVRLVEWDVAVVDQGSANGTYIRMPGHQEWLRAMPNQLTTLAAGAQILLGGRILTFDSQHSQF